tara:strand:+ start:50 stop:919 length:870 start_codon:yes stop_codon:yes gene_type:complete
MAARAPAIPANNPAGVPYVLPLPALPAYAAADPVVDPLVNPLQPAGAVTPYAAPAGPNAARPTEASLALNPAGPQPAAVPAGTPGGMDAWQLAIQNAQLGANYLQNSNYVAEKANEFRTVAVQRLREIYGRLLSIQDQVAVMGPAAAAAGNAQAALVELIDAVNAQGYIDPQQAQAMADLATALQGVDIPRMMAGLMGEINQIANTVGVVLGNRNANDQGPVPLAGGRRKRKKAKKSRKKKKKHKGGFKYTRIANSRRSLRMTRRKSLRHKTHHKKRKRTKKHRGRKRR